MTGAGDVARSKNQAKKHAQTILDKALAKEMSERPSGPRGGDLGKFPEGAMVPAFEEGMLEVEAGKVVPRRVESPFGFHVILRKQAPLWRFIEPSEHRLRSGPERASLRRVCEASEQPQRGRAEAHQPSVAGDRQGLPRMALPSAGRARSAATYRICAAFPNT